MGDVRTTPAPRPASILEPSKCMIQLEYAPYSLGSLASVHSATKSASTWDLMALRGLYVMSNGRSSMAHFGNLARCVPVVYYIIEGHFGGHRDRALLKVVLQFSRCHEDCICYFLIMRVPGFAWCEDGGYVVYRLLEREFVSVLFSFDDEYGAHHLVCC